MLRSRLIGGSLLQSSPLLVILAAGNNYSLMILFRTQLSTAIAESVDSSLAVAIARPSHDALVLVSWKYGR